MINMGRKQADRASFVSLTQICTELQGRVPAMAAAVLAKVWGIPGYDDEHLPSSELAGYLQPSLHNMINGLRRDDATQLGAETEARQIGAARALQGVPIDAVIRSWETAERVLRDHLLQVAASAPAGELRTVIGRLAEVGARLTDLCVEGYRKTQDEVTIHYDRLTTDLLARLTGDQPAKPGEIRRRARSIGIDPSVRYTAVTIGVRAAHTAAEPHTYLRIQRQLLATVGARSAGRVLVGTIDEFPLLLVPWPGGAEKLVPQLESALARPGGADRVIVGVSASAAELPAAGPACQQARDALEIGRRLPSKRMIVRFADVATDVLLLRNPDIAAVLAGRIRDLAGRAELLDTLRTYLECGMSSRETARRMYVHPNTVPYRLKSIEHALGMPLSSAAADPGLALSLRALALGDPAMVLPPQDPARASGDGVRAV